MPEDLSTGNWMVSTNLPVAGEQNRSTEVGDNNWVDASSTKVYCASDSPKGLVAMLSQGMKNGFLQVVCFQQKRTWSRVPRKRMYCLKHHVFRNVGRRWHRMRRGGKEGGSVGVLANILARIKKGLVNCLYSIWDG